LFVLNALTYVVYVCVLVAVVRGDGEREPVAGGYRVVLRDGPFVRLVLTNVAMIAVGWGVLAYVVPPYARGDLGTSARLIGLLLLANAATVVVAQMPIVRLAEGRRRVAMLALAAAIWVVACLLVLSAHLDAAAQDPALVAAAIVFGIGECFHSTALAPLVAELAPAGLRGRYMAAIGLSWWAGLALAPTLGTQLLTVSPAAALLGAAAVAAAAGAAALTLEPALPEASRLTPRPR
jgi:MFS family permease